MSGFFISAAVFYVLNLAFPVPNMDQIDQVDIYGTFTAVEARRIGVVSLSDDAILTGISSADYKQTLILGGRDHKTMQDYSA